MLRTHIPGFDQEKYAFQIAWMLWQTTVPSRQHNHYLDGVWFTTKEIRELFGEVKHFREVNRHPRYFMVPVTSGDTDGSMSNRISDQASVLKPRVVCALRLGPQPMWRRFFMGRNCGACAHTRMVVQLKRDNKSRETGLCC